MLDMEKIYTELIAFRMEQISTDEQKYERLSSQIEVANNRGASDKEIAFLNERLNRVATALNGRRANLVNLHNKLAEIRGEKNEANS